MCVCRHSAAAADPAEGCSNCRSRVPHQRGVWPSAGTTRGPRKWRYSSTCSPVLHVQTTYWQCELWEDGDKQQNTMKHQYDDAPWYDPPPGGSIFTVPVGSSALCFTPAQAAGNLSSRTKSLPLTSTNKHETNGGTDLSILSDWDKLSWGQIYLHCQHVHKIQMRTARK